MRIRRGELPTRFSERSYSSEERPVLVETSAEIHEPVIAQRVAVFSEKLEPYTIAGLLATVVLLFAFQGPRILE